MEEEETYRFGWIPDYPDFRDYTEEHEAVKPLLEKTSVESPERVASLPASVDISEWCSEIENQKSLNSCPAHAGVGLIEYYERKAFGRHIDASRLFLYKVTRNLLHWTGDRGAPPRTTMSAIVLFGVPPEEYWPYTDKKPDFDKEPPAFCYALAQNYQTIKYFNLDHSGIPSDQLLSQIKTYIASKLPPMFGFWVYSSRTQATRNGGKIPYPSCGEGIDGSHIVVAVGYDDKIKIKNTLCGLETIGALRIRNSYGTDWGDEGYGWLPYEYVLKGLALDFWVILSKEWVDTGEFKM